MLRIREKELALSGDSIQESVTSISLTKGDAGEVDPCGVHIQRKSYSLLCYQTPKRNLCHTVLFTEAFCLIVVTELPVITADTGRW